MISTIIILGFILRVVYTIYWSTVSDFYYIDNDYKKVKRVYPTKKEALKFYLIPFYWIIIGIGYLFTKVFKE